MKNLLASIVLFISSCSPVLASYQDCVLDESQLSVLQFSYDRGVVYDLGLSLAAIAYRESRAGLWNINLQGPSAGYYHITLDKVIRRMGWDYTPLNLNRAAQLLIDDPYLASDLAIEELQYWQSRRGADNWSAVWASYNAGNAGLNGSRGGVLFIRNL